MRAIGRHATAWFRALLARNLTEVAGVTGAWMPPRYP